MSKQLLVDYTIFEVSPQQINESLAENNGRLIVNGVLQRAGAKNQNGRIYPMPILQREADHRRRGRAGRGALAVLASSRLRGGRGAGGKLIGPDGQEDLWLIRRSIRLGHGPRCSATLPARL